MLLALPASGAAPSSSACQRGCGSELKKLSAHSAHVCREIFAGILVLGLVAIVLGYGTARAADRFRLASLVPSIEAALDGEFSDLHVQIDDAILQRSPDGPASSASAAQLRLLDKRRDPRSAPLAAIGMKRVVRCSRPACTRQRRTLSARACTFRILEPGLSLSCSRSAQAETEAPAGAPLPAKDRNSNR